MVDKFVVVRWLLSHTGVLREIADIVKGWATADLKERLDIVYQVTKALLPVIESFPFFQAQALPVTEEEANEELRTVEAMGLPIPLLVNVIAPIVVSLIQVILSRREEE